MEDIKKLVEQANSALQQGRYEQALQQYRRALALMPNHPGILNNCAAVLEKLNRLDEALATYEQAQAQMLPHAGIMNNCGVVLMKLHRLDEALARFDRAVALSPQYAEAFNNRGTVLFRLRRLGEALNSYDHANAMRPGHVTTLYNRALVLQELKRYGEAGAAFVEVLQRDPAFPGARQHLLNNRLRCCDWTGYAASVAEVIRGVDRGETLVEPFYFLSVADRALSQLKGAQTLGAQYSAVAPDVRPSKQVSGRIHVAYLCGEFGGHHAIWYLTEGLFKNHDRTRFKVTGVSVSPKPTAAAPHFDEWIDASRINDADVALLLRQQQVDIAVDLNGFSGNCRPGIFAHRAAPVQINWIGFPGTMGMPSMDYIIADQHVIQAGSERFYTESVIRLPDMYMVNNHRQYPIDRPTSRAENALPEGAFVFCCFNNNYKIRPDVFDVWMRLLRDIDGSVLWLLGDNADAIGNLRREAEKRGVAGSRLIFAPRVGGDAHLARQGCADLFLDTFPYTAHTTATDALWAGLPVITYSGETFASRVAGSFLKAAGLPELVTTSLADYEQLARKLATEPNAVGWLKEKLQANRLTCRLFDVDRFQHHLETAFTIAHERRRQGLSPGSFGI
jgi:predicted O-linked N-acetylglucosamine transferase (SPINDLY family)